MRKLRKLVWVKADWAEPWQVRERFVTSAVEAGASGVVVPPQEAKNVRKLGALTTISKEAAPDVDVVMSSARSVAEVERAIVSAGELRKRGCKVAICIEITDKAMERAAIQAGKAVDFLVTIGRDWKVIPLENLIAELHRADVKILAGVKNVDEAKTAVETLEIGADGVLLDPREKGPEEITKVCEELEKLVGEKLELVPAKVTSVRPVGMGDRVCVDTCSMMSKGEGMLVGSQASGLFLVHSETLPSKFVEPRPFRVNAGAVHAYIRLPEGKTKYLSELRSGDEVLIVNTRGETRSGIVGRLKIERRPLLLIQAEREGEIFRTLAQNAETINFVTKDGKPIPVTELKPGDEVLVYIERVGRHFGVEVAETIVER